MPKPTPQDKARPSSAANSAVKVQLDSAEPTGDAPSHLTAAAIHLADGKAPEEPTGPAPWAETGEQAVDQVHALEPKDIRAAVEKMPSDERAAFDKDVQSRYNAETDPKKKLKLWGLMHRNRVEISAEKLKPPSATDTSPAADLLRMRIQRQEDTRNASRQEIDDELNNLTERMAKGEKITAADIEALNKRKGLESEIEQKYGINLTNSKGTEKGQFGEPVGERRVWSQQELQDLDRGLSKISLPHLRDNPFLKEIKRAAYAFDRGVDVNGNEKWTPNLDVGGDVGDGIRIYDTGAGFDPKTGKNSETKPWRIQDPTSTMAGHDGPGQQTTLVGEVISHEVGHMVQRRDREKEFGDISGWETDISGKDMQKRREGAGLTQKELDNRIAADGGTDINGDYYTSAGPNSYNKTTTGAIPMESEWSYAASHPAEQFAEIYAKSVHEPEELYKDLVEQPEADAWDMQDRANNAATTFTRNDKEGAPKAQLDDLKNERDDYDSEADLRWRAADARRGQRDFMRNKVFKTDDSKIQSLKAPTGKEDVYDNYKYDARRAMTPEQLKAVKEKYKARL